MAPLKLSDKRLAELSNLWSFTLSEPPPQNLNDLWQEYLNIRQTLNVSDEKPFNFSEAFDRPGPINMSNCDTLTIIDRDQSINDLLKQLDSHGVDYSAVETRSVEGGYGLFASKDLESNTIPLELPHKLLLSLDYSKECPDIKYILKDIQV